MDIHIQGNSRTTEKAAEPIDIDRRTVARYAMRHGLTLPKMLRKVSWRIMVQAMPREVARFIQNRFGELRISEARYEDLPNRSR
ncbi:MAG: hypothetical protein QW406_06310 [Ignisphaera sp.]|uniref:Uncharacterized protein n=1 Tax=Ignisphaera aggregans TaxID=334771 RepID=A0A7J3JPG8_9CREN